MTIPAAVGLGKSVGFSARFLPWFSICFPSSSVEVRISCDVMLKSANFIVAETTKEAELLKAADAMKVCEEWRYFKAELALRLKYANYGIVL